MAAAIPPKVSRIVDMFVSFAAAVVIWGALQKLLHTPSADFFLKLGLGTEALVFSVYGFLYLYYPAIADSSLKPLNETTGNPALKSMEKMLQEADITPTNLGKLSAGFQKLGSTVEKMGEIGDVVKATGDYTQKTKEAAQALDAVRLHMRQRQTRRPVSTMLLKALKFFMNKYRRSQKICLL